MSMHIQSKGLGNTFCREWIKLNSAYMKNIKCDGASTILILGPVLIALIILCI
jgi:hypothetical protein